MNPTNLQLRNNKFQVIHKKKIIRQLQNDSTKAENEDGEPDIGAVIQL